MSTTTSDTQNESNEYKLKYNSLLKEYLKQEKRISKILKISDKNSMKFLEELKKLEKISHRSEIIIKHSDKQGRKTITEKKNVEKALEYELAINYEQERLLKEKSKLAAMGEMIENIAHQFKQPLSTLSTIVSGIQLKKDMDDLSNAELDEFLLRMDESVKYLNDTIGDFRDFFNSDKTKDNFDIKNVALKCLDLLSYRIKIQNVNIIFNIDECNFFGQKNELIQVIMNLLVNSLDALKQNSICKGYIQIDLSKNDNAIQIVIKDNANGIKDEIIEDIFKAHFTTKGEDIGSGIGLYMSKRIINEHFHGDIKAKNHTTNNEKGAEFIITLPL